jgi:hypothetical protein
MNFSNFGGGKPPLFQELEMFSQATDPKSKFEILKINIPDEPEKSETTFPIVCVKIRCIEFDRDEEKEFCYRIGKSGVHMTRLMKPKDATLPQSYETTLRMVKVLNPILNKLGFKTQSGENGG